MGYFLFRNHCCFCLSVAAVVLVVGCGCGCGACFSRLMLLLTAVYGACRFRISAVVVAVIVYGVCRFRISAVVVAVIVCQLWLLVAVDGGIGGVGVSVYMHLVGVF